MSEIPPSILKNLFLSFVLFIYCLNSVKWVLVYSFVAGYSKTYCGIQNLPHYNIFIQQILYMTIWILNKVIFTLFMVYHWSTTGHIFAQAFDFIYTSKWKEVKTKLIILYTVYIGGLHWVHCVLCSLRNEKVMRALLQKWTFDEPNTLTLNY